MKKVAGVLVVAIAVLVISATYRAYRARTEAQLATQRAALEERENDDSRREAAEKEALRLKELQAQQAAAAAEQAIAELKAQQAAADAASAEHEAQAARWQAELDRLRQEKSAAEGEAQQLADKRRDEIAQIEAAQADALAKLRSIELQRSTSRDRDAARAAALAHQIEVEKQAEEQLARLRAAPPG